MTLNQSLVLLRQQLTASSPTPETIKLLKAVWPKLSDEERQSLLEALGSPPSDEIVNWRTDDELHLRLLRQWRWLAGISDNLPDEWATAYRRMVNEFGDGDPDARVYATYTQVGSISPLTVDEVLGLGPDALVEWLADWDPPPDRWGAPTPVGLASRIQEAVTDDPEPWIEALPGLVERLHHPTYVRGVLSGLRDRVQESEPPIDWSKLIGAFELVVSEPWPARVLTDDPFDADRDWDESQREVVRLLERGFQKDADLDNDQLRRTWDLLLRLVEKGRQQPSHIVSGHRDLVELAINKDSTASLEAMFHLALNAHRRAMTKEQWGERLAEVMDDELREEGLERLLAAAITARFFPQFMLVAHERALELLPRLFGQPEEGSLSAELLETLLKYARPITNELLELFRPHLVTYFATVPSEAGDAERSSVRWLMIAYLRRLPGQDDPAQAIELLAEPGRISEAAEFYGRVLRQEAQGTPEELQAALGFWDAVLESDPPPDALLGFGWWSEAAVIPDEDWLRRVVPTLRQSAGRIDWDHEVVLRLVRTTQFPDAWEALALLVRGADERWTVAYWAGDLQKLLESTADADEPIRSLRRELVEALLEREMLDFRRFLEAS